MLWTAVFNHRIAQVNDDSGYVLAQVNQEQAKVLRIIAMQVVEELAGYFNDVTIRSCLDVCYPCKYIVSIVIA